MLPGTEHRLTLTTNTPGSGFFIDTEYFLTNKPPYGGSCSVDPLEGYAAHTNFSAFCQDWKEWRGNKGLKYEYRVQQYGAKRSLLFYFGKSPLSTPSMMPVGNHKMDFLAEMVLLIYDSIGDFYMYKVNATVRPFTALSIYNIGSDFRFCLCHNLLTKC